MKYTGEIKNAYLLSTVDTPHVMFVYGTIVYDVTGRFSKDDWIATSYLIDFNKVKEGHRAVTRNSVYFIRPAYKEMTICWGAVDNIRLGTNPERAMQLYRNSTNISRARQQ